MPPPRASRLAARKSLGVNMHDFQVESSPEPQPTASTSAVAPPTAPLPRRSGRTSLEANATLDLPKPPSKQTAKPNTKPKAPSATQKRKSLLNNKRLRSEPEQDSADDEGEEESSFLDASKSHLNPKFPAPPPPIKSALKAANPEKKSRGVAVIQIPSCFYPPPFAHSPLSSSREQPKYSTKPRPSTPTTSPTNPTTPTRLLLSALILRLPAQPSPRLRRRGSGEQIPTNRTRPAPPRYVLSTQSRESTTQTELLSRPLERRPCDNPPSHPRHSTRNRLQARSLLDALGHHRNSIRRPITLLR